MKLIFCALSLHQNGMKKEEDGNLVSHNLTTYPMQQFSKKKKLPHHSEHFNNPAGPRVHCTPSKLNSLKTCWAMIYDRVRVEKTNEQ